jgi:nitrate reductase assembly molybdenum cofactor insertion protein NarJ
MPARKKPHNDTDELAAALEQTLLNAERGLQSFLASLQTSGLPEAVGGYRQLQALLLQQRLWAVNQERAELDENFARLAQLAGALHQIFQTYADIFNPLCELDKITAMQAEPATATPPPKKARRS